MTTDDIAALRAKLADYRTRRAQAAAKLMRLQTENAGASRIGHARHTADMWSARVDGLERRLRTLQIAKAAEYEEHDSMMKPGLEHVPTPPISGYVVKCFRTLNLNGKVYPRGSIVPESEIVHMRHFDQLIFNGSLRWTRPTPAPQPKSQQEGASL